jgi:hypothetical protein
MRMQHAASSAAFDGWRSRVASGKRNRHLAHLTVLRMENASVAGAFLPWLSAARVKQATKQQQSTEAYIAGLQKAAEDGVALSMQEMRDLVTSRSSEVQRSQDTQARMSQETANESVRALTELQRKEADGLKLSLAEMRDLVSKKMMVQV